MAGKSKISWTNWLRQTPISEFKSCVSHWKFEFVHEILDFPAIYSFRNVSYHFKNMCVEFRGSHLTYNQVGLTSKCVFVTVLELLWPTFQKSIIFKPKDVFWTEMLTFSKGFWVFLPPTAFKTFPTTPKTCALNSATPSWPTTNLVWAYNLISWVYLRILAKIQKNSNNSIVKRGGFLSFSPWEP